MRNNIVKIIAEAGVNHDGNLEKAFKLIDIASNLKANFIKFQTFKADLLVVKNAKKARYQMINSPNKRETHYEMLKKLELNYNDHISLIDRCRKKKIKFLSTPFDIDSFFLLKILGLRTLKISSGDLTNIPLLEKISLNSPKFMKIILSTGMGTIKEIDQALKALTKYNLIKKNITILHCTSNYPASDKSVNMNALISIRKKFGNNIGYSDHTFGNIASIIALSMGAKIIEKHFTINKLSSGPDHKISLSPKELRHFVHDIHRASKMLGSFEKKASKEEEPIKKIVRKSLVANSFIKKGNYFTSKNITVKRPGTGLEPKYFKSLLKKKAKKNYKKDQLIIL